MKRGRSATHNLLFQYPEVYKTRHHPDSSGQPAYLRHQLPGTLQEATTGKQGRFCAGAITYANKLEEDLLCVQGTGNDNLHYNHAEQLVGELVKA